MFWSDSWVLSLTSILFTSHFGVNAYEDRIFVVYFHLDGQNISLHIHGHFSHRWRFRKQTGSLSNLCIILRGCGLILFILDCNRSCCTRCNLGNKAVTMETDGCVLVSNMAYLAYINTLSTMVNTHTMLFSNWIP